MDLIKEYDLLWQEPDNAPKTWYQDRGYKFEKLILEVLKRDELCPRASYKIDGEQIDGSFVLGDRVYLLEAKWHKKEMSASDIYSFKGKVDGKLIGTIGIFISISGFSKDSVDALICGKNVNIILFDKNDFEISLREKGAFKKILLEKIRVAAEEGSPFYPIEAVSDVEDKETREQEVIETEEENPSIMLSTEEIAIICEGHTDEFVLKLLCQKMKRENVRIITANSVRNIPLLANKLMADTPRKKVLLVADSDGNENRVLNMFRNEIKRQDGWRAVIINDSIEDWFGIDRRLYKGNRGEVMDELVKRVDNANIEKMKKEFESFALFCELINVIE